MASFNRVILLGNLTRDPELRYIPSGTAVCEVGLAVNHRRKNPNGEWIEETTFVDVTMWERTAEVANQYLSKGSPVLIEGRLKLDTWEDKDGQKRSKLRVVCERMQMLGKPGGGSGGGGGGSSHRDDSEYSQPAEHFDAPPVDAPPVDAPPVDAPPVAAASSATKPQQGDDIPF